MVGKRKRERDQFVYVNVYDWEKGTIFSAFLCVHVCQCVFGQPFHKRPKSCRLSTLISSYSYDEEDDWLIKANK